MTTTNGDIFIPGDYLKALRIKRHRRRQLMEQP